MRLYKLAGFGKRRMTSCRAKKAIAHVRSMSCGPPASDKACITINFHPDALYRDELMIDVLAREGVYRSQFETRTSNGGLTAHRGGKRWTWESRIFGKSYDDAKDDERPKYGALNLPVRSTGGSPRFGSCHLRLRPHVLQRATFCYPDSHFEPEYFGVVDRMGLVRQMEENADDLDFLDNYIEAHIHGALKMWEDVDAIVLDPCYERTEIEASANNLGCKVEWHSGFQMRRQYLVDCVGYRGADVAALAESMLETSLLTPRAIGLLRKGGQVDPQMLKLIWHCVAKFGRL